ncbi:MAG: ATP-binding protein [Bryobacteraceae bacterium]
MAKKNVVEKTRQTGKNDPTTAKRPPARAAGRYEALFEAASDGILVLEIPGGSVVDANPAACRLLRCAQAELLGKPLGKVGALTPDQAEEILSILSRDGSIDREGQLPKQNGTAVHFVVRGGIYDSGGARRLFLILRDLTMWKRESRVLEQREERLRLAQKLEPLQRLASASAHEFNNLLTPMLFCAEAMLQRPGIDDTTREEAEEIKRCTERASALTTQLLQFSRRQPIQPKLIDLAQLVNGVEMDLQKLAGDSIALSLEIRPATVRADRSQIEQIVLNLASNAVAAMQQEGGTLSITTGVCEFAESPAHCNPPIGPGQYGSLFVRDTGAGMDEATQSRIFEPFFTSRSGSLGRGLGLAMVFGIATQAGGAICVESVPGKGSTFTVYLPYFEGRAEDAGTVAEVSNDSGGAETVLVVEDLESVNRLVSQILRDRGYRVLYAHHSGEALFICEGFEGPIHLLLTDLQMPGMDGSELARQVQAVRPDTRVLYMTGHGPPEFEGDILLKPFSAVSLARKVRDVLDRP